MVQSISTANGDHQTPDYFLRQEGKNERSVALCEKCKILDHDHMFGRFSALF